MTEERKYRGSSRAAIAWRVAGIVQGVGVVSVAAMGALWALSMDGSPFQAPEGPPARIQVPPVVPTVIAPVDANPGAPSGWTFYIVGSELEAKTLRDAITAGNNIRHSLGLDLMREEVLVVNNSAEAQLLAEQLYEGNRILASFGVEDRVVNLVA
jgi:hypothetical protein